MKFNSRGGISVFELVVYFPALALAAIVCSRHGFGRNVGWVFTLILCLVRLVGACCQLATYHSETKGLIETVLILDSVGISPLLLATLGILSRCADSIGDTSSGLLKTLHFRLLQLLVTCGLILCIVGGTNSISSTGVYHPQTTTKAGVAVYLLGFMVLVLLAIVITTKLSNGPGGEKKLVVAVLVALPFIFVRIIYSLLSVFSHNHHFNIFTGSVAILVVMAILEEMIVVWLYLLIGWTLDKAVVTPVRGPLVSRPWKGNLGDGDGAQGKNRRRRQGPIHALVYEGVAAAQH